ncbi:LpxI family protein [Rhodalgimonas zhirmunskyi]|uniref:UDP-2,3-diacylglucosamine diphosphatase LpxI n=1 Tax=Rhodalgimonas zhirmunskyi TaxID=2964767 RepID=A0AAJ1X317_9RHOB|nr:UDP-2,3-diacylglucosamine diphosphatase LpxI [Rhodoalgimonas zhirmunskyi]MDQ2092873.1 UDP-2,3-diacylglucosamine diphosphatase LpxI [Rhodoalgimonas zhirmunskyi]
MLALICGRGHLPGAVASAQDVPPLICALEGQEPAGLVPDIVFRLETLGSLLLDLGERGVREVCFCGAIARPVLDPTQLDDETKPLVPLFQEALALGDDGALRIVISIFEQTGFVIKAAHELDPGMIPVEGVLTKRAPREGHKTDAALGPKVIAQMGETDLGQACVIRKGRILAREDDAGTDAMIARFAVPYDRPSSDDPLEWAFNQVGALAKDAINWLARLAEDTHDAPGAGAILYKAPKPKQDRRADLPVIGPGTAIRAAEAGFDGIVIEAGGVMVLDRVQVIQILDAMNMFLWVRGA